MGWLDGCSRSRENKSLVRLDHGIVTSLGETEIGISCQIPLPSHLSRQGTGCGEGFCQPVHQGTIPAPARGSAGGVWGVVGGGGGEPKKRGGEEMIPLVEQRKKVLSEKGGKSSTLSSHWQEQLIDGRRETDLK